MGGGDDFFASIAAAHRVDDSDDRPVLEPDPLESEPESDDEDRADGVFSPDFVKSTGVHEYMRACKEAGVVPVQQFISMMDREVVSLKHRGVGAAGGRALFECLVHNQHIQTLDLEDNQLGLNVDIERGELGPMCEALARNAKVTCLDLSYNNFAARGCEEIARALEENGTVRELSLRGNNMGNAGAAALGGSLLKAFKSSCRVAKLDLSDNGVCEAGGVALAGLLATPALPLKQADLSWNSLRAGGTVAIAECLKTASLVRLNLSWNGMGERGAAAIGEALGQSPPLQFLDVSSNRIPTEGAVAIAAGLAENTTLRSLQLNGNPIRDRGAIEIIKAVGAQCSVRDPGLHDCWVSAGGAGLFDPRNPTGRYRIDLKDGYEKDEIFEQLRDLDRKDEKSNIENFINVKLNGKEIEGPKGADGEPPAEFDIQAWEPPAEGRLTFDYVEGKKVPKTARAQRDEVFQSFRREVANPALSETHRLLMLRTAATTHFWSAAQVRQLVSLIAYQQRVDAAVMLFKRTVDQQNFAEQVYRLLKPSERGGLRGRLGEALTPRLSADDLAEAKIEVDASRRRASVDPRTLAKLEEADVGESAVVFLTEEVPATAAVRGNGGGGGLLLGEEDDRRLGELDRHDGAVRGVRDADVLCLEMCFLLRRCVLLLLLRY